MRRRNTEGTLLVLRQAEKGSECALPRHEDEMIGQILKRFPEVFRDSLPEALPPERTTSHEINTGDATPVNINSYPMSDEKLREQMRQVEMLLQKGLIRPSASGWGFPVIFVKKANGTWRMCIDYRALNQLTAKNGYPLPRIHELLDRVGQAKVLTKIDLASGYWQIRMEKKSIEKTAFNTIWGKYEWLAMPFGLCNAPATFQTVMNEVLRPFLGTFVVVYLDDILIYSDSMEDHYDHLEKVLSALHNSQLIAQPSKCVIAAKELEFCGHIVGSGRIRPLPAKVDVIRTWPKPRNVHELRQFVGLATYYRRFIKGFAQICVPLHELFKETDEELRRDRFRPLRWTTACESAVSTLKRKLINAPVMAQPDLSKPFTIETDASEWAIGMVLLQMGADGKLHPIAYDGRKLSGAELNYPVQEKELLAIKEALRLWDRYIENGTQTTIVTDHASLQYLTSTKTYSKRLARWVAEFQEYDLRIQYRKGSDAVVPDALSRRPDFVEDRPANISKSRPTWNFSLAVAQAIGRTVMKVPEDEWLSATRQFLETRELPVDPPVAAAVKRFAPKLSLRDDEGSPGDQKLIFAHEDGLYAPYLEPIFRGDLLNRLHKEFGHLGYPGLMGVLRPRAWWPQLQHDVEDLARSCPNCQISQGSRTNLEREPAQHMVTAGIRPFQRWGIDLIGPLPKTPNGNKWIVTAIDYATGWPVAKALQEATEEELGQFLHDQIFANYGAPMELLSDNGPNLLSGAVRFYLQLMRTKHRTTTPYHPRTNGKVENLNGLLGRMLTKYLMGKPTRAWDLYLTQAIVATRFHEHAVTGYSPFYLVYGIQPRLPGDELSTEVLPFCERTEELQNVADARTKANELLLARAIRTKRIRDSAVTKTSFKKGDWVLVRNESGKKFESKWFGPYRVLSSHPLGTYALEEPSGRVLRSLINGSRLLEANVANPTTLWTSSAAKAALRRAGLRLQRPEEVRKVLEDEHEIPDYSELATFTREEWADFRRNGARHELVGEEAIADRVIAKRIARNRAKRRRKDTAVKRDAEDSATGLSESSHEESDQDNGAEEDVPQQGAKGPRDANAYESTLFDGPLAVVVPSGRSTTTKKSTN
jgi:hypothetical protein